MSFLSKLVEFSEKMAENAERMRIASEESLKKTRLEIQKAELERRIAKEKAERERRIAKEWRQGTVTEEERNSFYPILLKCVSSWEANDPQSLRHKWLVPYYPEYRAVTDTMRDDRKFILDFQDAMATDGSMLAYHQLKLQLRDLRENQGLAHTTSATAPVNLMPAYHENADHTLAIATAVLRTYETLLKTFGFKFPTLTLVCMPTSNAIYNKQLAEFSRAVCHDDVMQDGGMQDGTSHIQVTSAATPNQFGSSGKLQKRYDVGFFQGKYVILFDVIRNTGKTLEAEKAQLESLGAKVIGAITLAQTF